MARNAEKAMSLLSRWVTFKKNERKFNPDKPDDPKKCDCIGTLEKFRLDMIRDMTKMLTQVQNAGLGEYRLRDLNDEINHMIDEKRKYEERIKELGGPDFTKLGQDVPLDDGFELFGGKGYKYFGATRDLPGVKELFENRAFTYADTQYKSKHDLIKCVDVDYYGFRYDDDTHLSVEEEEAEELRAREAAIQNWKSGVQDPLFKQIYVRKSKYKQFSDLVIGEDNPSKLINLVTEERAEPDFSTIPTQSDVEMMLLERKKVELMEKYVSEEMMNEFEESRKLLDI